MKLVPHLNIGRGTSSVDFPAETGHIFLSFRAEERKRSTLHWFFRSTLHMTFFSFSKFEKMKALHFEMLVWYEHIQFFRFITSSLCLLVTSSSTSQMVFNSWLTNLILELWFLFIAKHLSELSRNWSLFFYVKFTLEFLSYLSALPIFLIGVSLPKEFFSSIKLERNSVPLGTHIVGDSWVLSLEYWLWLEKRIFIDNLLEWLPKC